MPYYSGEERPAPDQPGRVLVVMAHPDDADFTAAGTVALWASHGAECVYLLCTDGNKGSDDPTMTPERLAPIRRAEQRAALAHSAAATCGGLATKTGCWSPPWHWGAASPKPFCGSDPMSLLVRPHPVFSSAPKTFNHPQPLPPRGKPPLAPWFPPGAQTP